MKKIISIILVLVFALSSFGGLSSKANKEFKFRDIELGISAFRARLKMDTDPALKDKDNGYTTTYYDKYYKIVYNEKFDVAGYKAICEMYFGNEDKSDLDQLKLLYDVFQKGVVFFAGKYIIDDIDSKNINKAFNDIKEKLTNLYGEPSVGKRLTSWISQSHKTWIILECVDNKEIQINYVFDRDVNNDSGL